MNKWIYHGCLVLLAAVLLLVSSGRVRAEWKAGVAKQKITPAHSMWLAGYGHRTHPSTGVLNDLHAGCLVLEDDHGSRVAFVTLDLVGISPDVADPIFADLEKQYGLPRSRVVLACSHTHSGPVVGHNLRTLHYDLLSADQQQWVDKYAESLKPAIVSLVGSAVKSLAPCAVSYGQGSASFAANRRNNKEPEVPRLRESGLLVGPSDHDVPVLKVTDPLGKLRCVLFGYACHATGLDGYEWSSDYPGFAQSELEAAHPGATALFVAGCGADQNPLPRRKVELAKQYGRDLAAAVDAVLAKDLRPIRGPIQVGSTQVELELASTPDRATLEQQARSDDRYTAARARLYLDGLAAGKSIPNTYSYPIRVWKLGDEYTFVSLAGEVVVEYAIKIKQDLGRERTFVSGYGNDVMAYIPSRRVLFEGGYEGGGAMVYYSLPSPWAHTIEGRILTGYRAALSDSK